MQQSIIFLLYSTYEDIPIPIIVLAILGILLIFNFYKFFTEIKPPISALHPAYLIATGLGTGRFPKAPGTIGSIFATWIVAEIYYLPQGGIIENPDALLWIFPIITLVTCILGIWASSSYMKKTGRKDPSEVVIDEIAGIFVAVLIFGLLYAALINLDAQFIPLMAYSPYYLLGLFILFRIFDIWKPGIIGKIDKNMKGGIGVMLDDIIAGIAAGLVAIIIISIMLYSGLFIKILNLDNRSNWVQEQPIE